jgi:hypothetical protein
VCISHIKSQILIQILTPFSTRTLLPLAPTSPRFSCLILRILHYRLLLAASLPSYKLILEAYHPTRKYSEPYLFCTYLGTPGLSPTHEGEGHVYEKTTEGERYGRLSQLYSRFRPERPGVEGSMPRRPYPAGGSGSQTDAGSSSQPVYANDGDGGDQKIEHIINLDSHELFSQFCTIANLVKIGPRRGVFLSVVNVEEKVMRVWREWLEAQAQASKEEEKRTRLQGDGAGEGELDPSADEIAEQTFEREQESDIKSSPAVLWTDYKHNVGLRVTIKDRKLRTRDAPILMSADEEQPVSYSIEIKGMSHTSLRPELSVATSFRIWLITCSLDHQNSYCGPHI